MIPTSKDIGILRSECFNHAYKDGADPEYIFKRAKALFEEAKKVKFLSWEYKE